MMKGLQNFSLENQIAVVTGASRGIGAALAQGLAEAGADVALVARGDCSEAAAAIKAVGRRTLVVSADLGTAGEGDKALAEVEAKLLVPRAADLRAMAAIESLGPYRFVARRTVPLHTRYFDTADFALARNGVALRVRRAHRRWELTAKWRGSVEGVVHSRPELTVALASPPGDPFRIENPDLAARFAALVAGRPLHCVLVTDIRRCAVDVLSLGDEGGETVLAEIALDRVHLHGEHPGPSERYGEVEVELRTGDLGDIERIVVLLGERFHLEPSTETKFSRGMALLHRFRLPAELSIDLEPDDSVARAARKLMARQLTVLRDGDARLRGGSDADAVHDMRVAVRRMRAVVRGLRDGFPPPMFESLYEELRWFGRELGTMRDLDVQLAREDALATAMPPALRSGLDEYREHLHRRREEALAGVRLVLDSRRYFQLLQRLERFVDGRTRAPASGPGGRPAVALAAETIAKAHHKLTKRGDKAGAEPLPEELHAVRIRAKRLRYGLEQFGMLAGKPARRAAARLAELQDVLGAYNDSVTAAGFVRSYVDGLGKTASPAALLALGAVVSAEIGRGEKLRRKFAKVWRRLRGKKFGGDIAATVGRLQRFAGPEEARRGAR